MGRGLPWDSKGKAVQGGAAAGTRRDLRTCHGRDVSSYLRWGGLVRRQLPARRLLPGREAAVGGERREARAWPFVNLARLPPGVGWVRFGRAGRFISRRTREKRADAPLQVHTRRAAVGSRGRAFASFYIALTRPQHQLANHQNQKPIALQWRKPAPRPGGSHEPPPRAPQHLRTEGTSAARQWTAQQRPLLWVFF